MDLQLLSPPLTQQQKLAVVSVEDVKLQGRIRHNDEDRLIARYIETAYDFLSGEHGWLNGCCLLREDFLWYTNLPSTRHFEIPMRPLMLTPAPTLDRLGTDGATYAAVDPAIWYPHLDGSVGYLALQPTAFWPALALANHRQCRVTFSAGFGTTKESIPSPLRQAIAMLAVHFFRTRETTGEAGRTVPQEVEYGLKALAGRYRFSPDHS